MQLAYSNELRRVGRRAVLRPGIASCMVRRAECNVMNILVIDDDASLRRTLRTSLEVMGIRPPRPATAARPWNSWTGGRSRWRCWICGWPRSKGLDLLPRLLGLAPGLHVVVVTAYATIETAVEAMRRRAFDYLPKPFTPEQLRLVLDRIAQLRRLQSQVEELEEQVRAVLPEADLQTAEPAMREALDVAFKTAASEATILLRGESGTGKGVLARAIHARSPRAAGPFVTVPCPSLSAELLESELFGHVQGAFTGAVRDTMGKVAAAEGGTLLLDEIGDLPLALQPKLLRLLQERCYERIGETRTRASNVRILAATNRDLEAEVAAGRFREDLFYRLNVIEVTLPPLAGAAGRHPAPGRAPAAVFRPAERQGPRDSPSRCAKPCPLRLARQHPRAAQCDRARRHPRLRAAGRVRRPAVAAGKHGTPPPTRRVTVPPVTLDQIEADHIRRVLASTATMEAAADNWASTQARSSENERKYGI